MDYNFPINLQHCKEVFQAVSGLVLYTHIPPVILCLFISGFVIWKKRDVAGWLLLAITFVFSLWVVFDLLLWWRTDWNTWIMFSWSILGIMSVFLFFLTYWFVHVFVTDEKVPPLWTLVLWAIAYIPVLAFTPTVFNLQSFDIQSCAANESPLFTNYYYSLGALAMLLMFVSWLRSRKNFKSEKQVVASHFVVFIGAELFTFSFILTGAVASYLVSSGLIPDFGVDQYGIATMGAFMGLLAYATVQYKAFNIKLLGAQVLVFALILLIASEYLFIQNETNRWLVTVTLILAIFFGLNLVRSVQNEVRQREKIELLAKDLQIANDQQVTLIHFITHQIKGFVTKSRNIFSMALEGDFGIIGDQLKPMLVAGFESDTKGVATIQEILNAANIKSGKVSYTMAPFDLKALVQEISNDLQNAAKNRGITLSLNLGSEPLMVNGDRAQLVNVFKNLVDNSIKYTPKGDVCVTLSKNPNKAVIKIADTGVGITPEDMKNLFTEGGHGKDSIKINVESTGFGLYIVKNIIDAHKGKVWAESGGAGKGSTFTVELPL